MLERAENYEALRAGFRWRIPERYNIGVDVCDKWADGSGRLALIHLGPDGAVERWSFDALRRDSNRLANVLAHHGVGRGDRVGILLPQRPETALAHIAATKLGAVAVPLFTLFGPDALDYRLRDSGARALIAGEGGFAKLAEIREPPPDLATRLSVDGPGGAPRDAPGGGPGGGVLDLAAEMARASDAFTPVATAADDPALLIYTSGTTGPPKGALHAHRVLPGHLPGVELPHNFFPQAGDLFWTPADWAWIGGLIDVLLPAWHHGVPVLSHRFAKFDPEAAFRLMADFGVRNAFLPPTALKMMRGVAKPAERRPVALRSIGSGGETLGAELLDWGRATFGLTINEFYGQTECNLVVANCAELLPVVPGSMGRPVPGHEVAVVDPEGHVLPPGESGAIAVRRPDPVMFLGYWGRPEATREKFVGDWLLTGDSGHMDEAGYLWFDGREDDVITSGGYRIGPGEIEDCLLRHPAVALAAAVGLPDPLRGERVKAFVVANPGQDAGPALAADIQSFVKTRLAAHEYPREVEFLDALPMTATGKIMRRVLRNRPSGQPIDSNET